MNLLCPNCQKMLQVPEQYAGQLMKCPLCTGTFTVPALPQAPAPPQAPAQQYHAPSPPPPPAASGGSAPAPLGYTHQRSYTISSRSMAWVAPLCLIAVFVLFFFPWIGMYPSGISVLTQNGWKATFGGFTADEVWQSYSKDAPSLKLDLDDKDKGLKISWMLVLYLVVLVPTLIVAVGSTLIHLRIIPVELPPSLTQYWLYRPLLVAGLCLVGLIFLIMQLASGFSLEDVAWDHAKDMVTKQPDYKKPDTDESRLKLKMAEGAQYGQFNLDHTTWLTLTVVFQALALIGALADFWIERRGPQAPSPRIDFLT